MPQDTAFQFGGVTAAPLGYTVPGTGEVLVKQVYAHIDGTSAGAAFYPCVRIKAPGGQVMAEYITPNTVAAGGSADVTWFPGLILPPVLPAPSPNPLGTLFAWYDFSDATTITLDGSSKISQIRDKTGNGHDLTQVVTSQRPGQTTVNALNAGLFVSANLTELDSVLFSTGLVQPLTVASVHTQTIAGSSTYFPGAYGVLPANPDCYLFNNGNFNQLELGSVSTGLGVSFTAPYTQQLVTGIYNGASSSFRLNGAATNGSLDGAGEVGSISIGTALKGKVSPYSNYMDGAVCEVLYYQGSLTAAQLSAVESYLKTKWATP